MLCAVSALNNDALRLIAELRPEDACAVYNCSNTITELQPFTTDKSSAKRAVLGTQAFGDTALYDALARVGQDLSGRAGKKVIGLFTDGKDNASTLNAESAIQRAKAAGVPVYTSSSPRSTVTARPPSFTRSPSSRTRIAPPRGEA